ncbi:predicted permease [Serpentinimonas maccroryi]|uniref:Predicted permease n=1 Tax=Serpentinimonas maccroryi TaxID=1458426 RepID=A0A060P0A6_9BURK|nr:sodium-dependent bicarbonate transport family permease [Serpentinimonas maccroryi]BAO84574.1 predicted permease [Serpentinimonas maccroryi]
MPGFDLLIANLIQPIILAFVLGAIAGFLRSELELPAAVVSLLAIYLLFSIGLEGGRELAQADLGGLLPLIGLTLFMVLAIPLFVYSVTRLLGRFDISNAAALAAHYGSVSTATFFSSLTLATAMGTPAAGYMVAMVALMEFAIIFSLLIARVAMARELAANNPGNKNQIRVGELLLDTLRGRGIILLGGGIAIGALTSDSQWERIAPFYDDLFRGILMLFLLEMGMTAARHIRAFREVGWFMLGFGTLVPAFNGIVGVTLAQLIGLDIGSSFVFGALCASASFIDAPAACRASLPEANPGIYLTSSLGITLPFNLLLGLPLFYSYALWLYNFT